MDIVGRAFELADTGDYALIRDITRRLKREGFSLVVINSHLSGADIKRQLIARCRAAREAGQEYSPSEEGLSSL
jgi:hypothetical protein